MFFIYIYMYVRMYTCMYIYVYIHRRSTLASDDNHNSLRTRVSSASFFLLLLPNEPWWPCLRFVPNVAHFFPLLPYLPSNDALYARPISLSLSKFYLRLLIYAHIRVTWIPSRSTNEFRRMMEKGNATRAQVVFRRV